MLNHITAVSAGCCQCHLCQFLWSLSPTSTVQGTAAGPLTSQRPMARKAEITRPLDLISVLVLRTFYNVFWKFCSLLQDLIFKQWLISAAKALLSLLAGNCIYHLSPSQRQSQASCSPEGKALEHFGAFWSRVMILCSWCSEWHSTESSSSCKSQELSKAWHLKIDNWKLRNISTWSISPAKQQNAHHLQRFEVKW